MGSVLNILGNHNLEFDSGKQAVQLFEDRLNVKLNNGTFQSEDVKMKITNVQDIQYFASFDYLEEHFDRWKEVRILTNYIYCPEISIFKKVIRYGNRCKYSYWENCILNENIPEELIQQHKFCALYWENARNLSIKLTRVLGGKTLVYFDDNRFQNEEPLYYEGESLEIFIDEMSKKWIPTAFEEIPNRKQEFNVRNGWYIEKVNANT